MNTTIATDRKALWVLGHRVDPLKSSGEFDAVRITTAKGVPGPPPHHHDHFAEMFIVISGSAQFMVNGETKRLGPGDCVDLEPGVVHTFANGGEDDLIMINTHSPKGFLQFFQEIGFEVEQPGSLENSVSEATIARVISRAGANDMHIAPATEHISPQ